MKPSSSHCAVTVINLDLSLTVASWVLEFEGIWPGKSLKSLNLMFEKNLFL